MTEQRFCKMAPYSSCPVTNMIISLLVTNPAPKSTALAFFERARCNRTKLCAIMGCPLHECDPEDHHGLVNLINVFFSNMTGGAHRRLIIRLPTKIYLRHPHPPFAPRRVVDVCANPFAKRCYHRLKVTPIVRNISEEKDFVSEVVHLVLLHILCSGNGNLSHLHVEEGDQGQSGSDRPIKMYSGATQDIVSRTQSHQRDLLPLERWDKCIVTHDTESYDEIRLFEGVQNDIIHRLCGLLGERVISAPNLHRSQRSRGLRRGAGGYCTYMLFRSPTPRC